jgi:creatinine amidohydrolase
MILSQMTWKEVDAASRDAVVLIPTGSLEQHGPHLPLFTDTLLATAACDAVEAALPERVIMTPAIWQGASGHHLSFSGTVSATFEGYELAIRSVVESLMPHGFWKFYILNGHGGNVASNYIATRRLKEEYPDLLIGHSDYFEHIPEEVQKDVMEGPVKSIKHACEAEASLMMHLHPDLVRMDLLRDDGLECDPPVAGMTWMFDAMTEEGSLGYATLGTAEKGKRLFEEAAKGCVEQIRRLADGVVLKQREPRS